MKDEGYELAAGVEVLEDLAGDEEQGDVKELWLVTAQAEYAVDERVAYLVGIGQVGNCDAKGCAGQYIGRVVEAQVYAWQGYKEGNVGHGHCAPGAGNE